SGRYRRLHLFQSSGTRGVCPARQAPIRPHPTLPGASMTGLRPPMHDLSVGSKWLLGKSSVEFRESNANCIDIGLVNNMPSAALEATERQFCARLNAAADGTVVRLTLYALPD